MSGQRREWRGKVRVDGRVATTIDREQAAAQFRSENEIPAWVHVTVWNACGPDGAYTYALAEWDEEEERQRRLAKADQE